LIFENHWSGVHVPHTCLPVCSFKKRGSPNTEKYRLFDQPNRSSQPLILHFPAACCFLSRKKNSTRHNEMIKALIPCILDSSCSKLSSLSLDSVQRITPCIWNKYVSNLTNPHLVECKPEGSLQVMEQ
jgi:hypothetical protein